MKNPKQTYSRRNFMKASAAAGLTLAAGPAFSFAANPKADKIRVGIIGTGGRGGGAIENCLEADERTEFYAMCDIFEDCVVNTHKAWKPKYGDRINVPRERQFTGFDGYQKLLDLDEIDMVILSCPPQFRPRHFQAAIEAGKHVFMEKPGAVDPVGARILLETADLADRKNLSAVCGTQRRHQKAYLELMKRIHDGALGEITGGSCFWCAGELWHRGRPEHWTEMEYQIRNWLYYTWLSGDHILEQHVHNIDVINWGIGAQPKNAFGMGGRQVRTDPKYGNVWDHFAVEYEYENGAKVTSMCRQTNGTAGRNCEILVGTKGRSYSDQSGRCFIEGENKWSYDGPHENPYVLEHKNLIESIRTGRPINQARDLALSTLTAVMGRMSAYTGRALSWNWIRNASKLDMRPEKYELTDNVKQWPVAAPGQTQLV